MNSPSPKNRVAIIMAGGSGERFWPLSRMNRPKQLLCLTSVDKNMLQEAVERLAPVIDPKNIFVVTGRHLQQPIRDANVGVPSENILAEPCKRDTAGCLCFAAAAMMARYGDPANVSMAVVTADHRIEDTNLFCKTVSASLDIAEREGALVTHGIVPDRAETGYGYIQTGDSELDEGGVSLRTVTAFHEKPDATKAQSYLDEGNYYWNSGMFFWGVDTFLAELQDAQPAMASTVTKLATSIESGDDSETDRLFESLEGISIDYALMEKAKRVLLAEARYPWDDVGSWLSLERTGTPDSEGNIAIGEPVLVNTRNTIVYNEPGAEHMAVGVVGLDDVVVVVSKDGVLVTRKDTTQSVKDVVRSLKDRGSDQI